MSRKRKPNRVPNLQPTHTVHKGTPKPTRKPLAEIVGDMSKLALIQRWAIENGHPIPSTLDEAAGMGILDAPAKEAEKRKSIKATPQKTQVFNNGLTVTPDPEEDRDAKHYSDLRSLILGQTRSPTPIPVLLPDFPDFDGKVFVKVWGIPEKHQLDQIILLENQGKDVWDYYTDRIVAWTVVLSACDADGDLIFSPSDIAAFLNPESDRRFKEEVWREAFRINGLFGRSHRAIVKNSEGTPNSSESSDSADSGVQASDKPTDGSATEQFGAGVLPEQTPS